MNLYQKSRAAVAQAPPAVRAFLLGSVLMGAGVALFEVLLNLYLQTEGLTKSQIGHLLSQRAIGTVLGSLVASLAGTRRKPSLIFAGAGILLFLSLGVLIFVRDDFVRQCAATSYGFSLTFRLVGAAPFFFRHVRDEWLATLLGLDAAIIAGTQVIGAAVAAAVFPVCKAITNNHYEAFQYTLLLGAFLALSSSYYFARTSKGDDTAREIHARAPAAPAPPLLLYIKMCLPFFFVGAGAGLTIPYLNLYFEDRFQATPSEISVYYAAVALTTTAGYLVSPVLGERFGLVRSVVFSEILSIPFFLILAWSTSLPVSVAAFLARGALMNLPYPLYGNLIMRLVGPAHRERANALTKLAWNGSWVVTARLAGWLIEERHGDYVPVMLTTAGLYLLASSTFWIFFGKSGL